MVLSRRLVVSREGLAYQCGGPTHALEPPAALKARQDMSPKLLLPCPCLPGLLLSQHASVLPLITVSLEGKTLCSEEGCRHVFFGQVDRLDQSGTSVSVGMWFTTAYARIFGLITVGPCLLFTDGYVWSLRFWVAWGFSFPLKLCSLK